jgi:hypothetical protein
MRYKLTVFGLFVFSRVWLYFFSGNPVGVDSWDYMYWIDQSVDNQELLHAPLHVPGFYALLSLIAVYTEIDIFILYVFVLPIIGSIALWFSLKPILDENYIGLIIASCFGFFTLRTSMIIPEWLGLILLPSVILSILTFDSNKSSRRYYLILGLLTISTLLSHHLSGGIILFILFFYALKYNNRKFYALVVVLGVIAILIWGLAGSFPIDLVILLAKAYLPYLPIPLVVGLILFILIKKWNFNISRYNIQPSLPVLMLSFMIITLLLILIGISVDVELFMLIYWLPASMIVLFSLLGLKSINNGEQLTTGNIFTNKNYIIWPASLLMLNMVISIFPVIRPLLSRLFIFQIQAILPLAAIGLIYLIDQQTSKRGTTVIIILILLFTFNTFHAYPESDAWFRTEFRYYDQEIEIAAISAIFVDHNFIIDTDNRIGVMFQAITGLNTTFGEYTDSWIHGQLVNEDYQFPDMILLSDVIEEIGFMSGKFIHGEGGGANQVSIEFDSHLFQIIQNLFNKVATNKFTSVWILKI